MAMPYERRVPFFGALARRVASPVAGYRRRALENLALVRPQWPEARRREVAEACVDNFGRAVIEHYSWRELDARLADTTPTGPGVPALEEARRAGRPVLFLTGHFGNPDPARLVLARAGLPTAVLYRPMSNPLVDRHYSEALEGLSSHIFPRTRQGVLRFVRHLAGGGAGVILFDLHIAGGTPIPFLGRPAATALTAAELALRHDALLVPFWGIRQPDGLGFETAVEEPIPHGTPLAMMEEATRRLEARIEAHPGQWFWVHRRWKRIRR
jgi:KDO2-lipid IV(A) lauroyltransferase